MLGILKKLFPRVGMSPLAVEFAIVGSVSMFLPVLEQGVKKKSSDPIFKTFQ